MGNGEEVKELPLGTVVAVTIPRGMFPAALTARERTQSANEQQHNNMGSKLRIPPKLTLNRFIKHTAHNLQCIIQVPTG